MTVFAKKYQNKNKKSRAYGKTYARAVMVGTVGIEELAEAMSESCTVTRSDIVAVLSALGPAMRRMLQKSLRVQLPYLGTFKLGLTTIGEEDAEDFDMQHNVKGVHVLFHPETKVNTRGQWENDLTRGTVVGELPKNLQNVAAAASDGDDEGGEGGNGGNSGQEEAGEDRP